MAVCEWYLDYISGGMKMELEERVKQLETEMEKIKKAMHQLKGIVYDMDA